MHVSKNQNTNNNCFFLGVLYSLGACFLWGLVFVVPRFLSQYKDIEIVLGRYFIFGLVSLTGALISNRNFFKTYSFKIWRTGFMWGILTNPVYYLGIVVGLRYAGPAITIVMTGLTPLTVLIYSNLKSKEVSQVTVAIISTVVIGGVLLTNLSILEQPIISTSFWKSIIGTVTVIFSTIIWTLYIIKNGKFLEEHPEVNELAWSYILGITTFFVTSVSFVILSLCKVVDLKTLLSFTSEGRGFPYIIGIFVLGVFSSSLASVCWNKASTRLSSALLGALLIFESLFGLLISFLVTMSFPTYKEGLGIIFMFGGSLYGLTLFGKKSIDKNKVNPSSIKNK